MSVKLTPEKRDLVNRLKQKFGDTVTRKQVEEFISENNLPRPRWLYNDKQFRAGRATYNLVNDVSDVSTEMHSGNTFTTLNSGATIPTELSA